MTRHPRKLRTRAFLLVIAAVLALPNLLTLYIAKSASKAAHAGQRIMDVDAGGFRNATLYGAIMAALVALLIGFFIWRHRRRSREITTLRTEVSVRDAYSRLADLDGTPKSGASGSADLTE